MGALGGSYGAGYTLVERDVEELGELLGQRGNEGWAFGVMSVLWTEERAKAVSREVPVGDPKVGGPMVLVWTLEKGAGGWGIVDIDLEGVGGLQRENARFMEEHPGAQVWLAKWLRYTATLLRFGDERVAEVEGLLSAQSEAVGEPGEGWLVLSEEAVGRLNELVRRDKTGRSVESPRVSAVEGVAATVGFELPVEGGKRKLEMTFKGWLLPDGSGVRLEGRLYDSYLTEPAMTFGPIEAPVGAYVAKMVEGEAEGEGRHGVWLIQVSRGKQRGLGLEEGERVEGSDFVIRGRVVDREGRAVTGAKIVPLRRGGHYGDKDVKGFGGEWTTGDKGEFVIGVHGEDVGKVIYLTVKASGYGLLVKEVALDPARAQVVFRLENSRAIRGQVVDESDSPVEGAYVRTKRWGTYEFHDRENGWFTYTGADGRFLWEEAPDAELVFSVGHERYMWHDVAMSPSGTGYSIVLREAIEVRGKVSDAKTGKAIEEFRVIPLGRYKRGHGLDCWLGDGESYRGGRFAFRRNKSYEGHMLGVEAQGYCVGVTGPIYAQDGKVVLDLQLRRREEPNDLTTLPGYIQQQDVETFLKSYLQGVPKEGGGTVQGEAAPRVRGESAGKGGAEVPARMVGSWELISERREHRQAYLDIRGDGFGTVYELDKKEPGRVSGGVYRIRVESANRLVLSVWTIGCTEPGVTALSYAISGRRMTWRDAGDDLVMKWRKVNDAADQSGTKRVFVPLVSMPEADTVLDLASGEVLPWQAKGDGARANGVSALRACREAGKGDLVWWGQDLVVLRGGKVARYEAGREEALAAGREVEDTTGYRLPEAPCRLLVTTGEGRRYKVDVVAAGIDGLLVEYGLIEGREAREAVDRGVAG